MERRHRMMLASHQSGSTPTRPDTGRTWFDGDPIKACPNFTYGRAR
jgi:hypothetical protein